MNKKRLIISSVISILLVSILMIGSTYSIFTSVDVDEDTNVYTTGNLNVTYTLSSSNIQITNSTPMSDKQAIMVMPYRITVTNNGNVPYMFDVILNDTTAGEVINYQYIMTQVGKLSPRPLNECENEVIKEDVIVPANSTVDIDVRIWISNKVQSTEIGKSFYAKLSIDGLAIYDNSTDINNSVLTAIKPFSGHVQSLYNDGSTINTVNIAGDASNPQVQLNEKQGIMLDNNGNYRYYGANPNNYVLYNDELWRIVSVGNVKAGESDTVGEERIKIIKASSLVDDNGYSQFVFDNDDSSDWTQADLMSTLNTLYYNSDAGYCYAGADKKLVECKFTEKGLSSSARAMIAPALWHLGSSNQGQYANTAYNVEHRTGAATWEGIVGMMTQSDYGYAADLSVCTTLISAYNNSSCTNNNWFFNRVAEYSLIPLRDYTNRVLCVYSGGAFNIYNATSSLDVRPVVYLKADIIVTGGNGTSDKPYTIATNPTNAAEYVENLYSDGSTINTVNIAGDASKPEVHLNANQGIMLDNNGDYRYYGANPNNYVKYNDELWRIISVGNVKANENDTVGETRVKIVKADILTAKETDTSDDITVFSYDSSPSNINSGYGVNDWSKSDLMTELNTLYYNSTSGTCYTSHNNTSKSCDFTNTGLSQTARNLTADALYYLGGSSSYEGLYADDYYDFERGTTVWGASADQTCNDGSCPRATTWTGRVGIIYPSDFIYATDLSVCKSDGYDYNTDICENNDWLLYTSNWQWTISPRSSTAYSAFYVYSSGSVYGNYGTLNPGAVQPVQYLKSNVAIVGGEGTSEKPYLLELW